MESDKRNIITFCIFAIALLISVASAESSIGISTGVPKIISMGQGVSSDFYQEVTLSLGVKNIGEQKGSFRLFAKNDSLKPVSKSIGFLKSLSFILILLFSLIWCKLDKDDQVESIAFVVSTPPEIH